jgi:MYXO-CTERM domain-containing protein
MKILTPKTLLPFVATCFIVSPAYASTVAGTIYDANGSGIGNGAIQVRLWERTDKGYAIAYETLTTTGGSYLFPDVAAGEYKLNARMAPGFSGHYGDTWYDLASPSSDGVFQADADLITVGEGQALSGLDIVLPFTGGLNGRIANLPNIWARAESTTDHRYHHNTLTRSDVQANWGMFSFRGLRDNHAFRVIVYDPMGRFETLVIPGPFGITNNTNRDVPAVASLTAIGTDPNEPNNAASNATAIAALPFSSEGAIIHPRGSDVDWYCLELDAGDRLLARAQSRIDIAGVDRLHPWVDPIMSFWHDGGTDQTMLMSNDDDPNGNGYSSFIDTGVLADGGRYCFVISTYGDQNWNGAGQQSTGRYGFDVEMGNRMPFINVTLQGQPVPLAPQTITVREGTNVTFGIAFGDPDGDILQPQVQHLDSAGQTVPGNIVQAVGGTTYQWSVSQDAAARSPHTLRFFVDDGEFVVDARVIVQIEAVNLPPTTPTPLAPIGGVRVDTHEVELRVQNATDPDNDTLTYEFELHEDGVAGNPDQTGSAVEHASGTTSWTTSALTENAIVSWRVRAFDGNPDNGYSPWSEWETFRVDAVNSPPDAPRISKPTPNERVLTRTPRISSTIPVDPDGDPVSIVFEVAFDVGFEDSVVTSDPIAATGAADSVEWTVSTALDEGTRYFVRAMARDDRGGESEWSDPVSFTIQPSAQSPAPQFGGSFGEVCNDYVIPAGFDALVVDNVDQSGDALRFELQVLRGDQVVYEVTVPQSEETQTTIALDPTVFTINGAYLFRVRTLIGDQASEWVECTGLVNHGTDPVDEPGTEPGPDPGPGTGNGGNQTTGEEGCGCAAAGSGAEGASWFAFLLMFLFGYRIRRRK